jgi:glycosyltransferase involved in cell wall biosynthesis
MHVAINGWFWNQPWTGSGQYVRNLVRAIGKLNATPQLTLVIPKHAAPPEDVPDGVEVVTASAFSGGNWGKLWFEQRSFPAAVRKLNADIAHVPYWGPPLSSKPARLVTSVLDIIPLVLPDYRGGALAALYTSLVSTGAEGAAHVLTLSEASKQDITEQLNISPERITVTYLGVDDRFHPQIGAEHDEAVRQKYDLPDEFVLYLGGFDRRKNVNTLLLAWTYAGPSLSEQTPLVLAGRQPQEWKPPLFPDMQAYAQELDVERYLIWLGEVDEADKPALYRLAKVVVFPSVYEGFGLPVLEAMACGTPVIAGNQSSIPEVAGEAAYLVDPTDARTMGAAILAVTVQDDLHAHLANAGRGQVTNFSWRKTAQQTLEVYQQVMEQ